MSLTVEIRGLEQLQRKFDMGNKIVKREASDAVESAAAVVRARAGTYTSPELPTYDRTGLLGKSFYHKVEAYSGGVKGIVGSGIPYAPYVRGDDMQAWMHVGRWATMKKIVDEKMDQIQGYFEKAMRNLAQFLGD